MASRIKNKLMVALVAGAALTVAAIASDGGIDLALYDDAEFGAVLVDGAGASLYLFVPDRQGSSTCYDSCAENWPPLLAEGEVTLGEGLDPELVDSVERTDGAEQITYGGWPLYTFVGDTEPGATSGQGVNDAWYLLTAEGAAAGAPTDSDEAEGDANEASDEFAAYMQEGSQVYARICAACHGANGNEELSTHVAILEENSRLENERLVARRVIHGGTYMPGFGKVLSDYEVAAVATFVRNSFGNDYGFVGEEAAAGMR